MDLTRWVENTLKIQSIPAPTFHEAARAQFMGEVFSSLNLLDVMIDQDHNVFARIPGESDVPLVVSAHLDSVFPLETSLTSTRKGNQIMGPGIGDNAVGLAALIELAHDHVGSIAPHDIWLVANVGEEGLGNLLGMRKVVERFGGDILAYLVLEGMALGHIYHQGLPIYRYRLTTSTIGGHAWIHAGRPSAVHFLCQVGAKLAGISLPDVPRWSLNIGRIGGGTSINSIAPEAWMELDLRAENQQTLALLDNEVLAAIKEIATDKININLEHIGNRPAGEIPEDHPLVRAACQALRAAGIQKCRLEAGSTDASVPLSQNLPAICIGLTFGSGAHSLEEHIEIQPLTQGYQALWRTMQACFTFNNDDE